MIGGLRVAFQRRRFAFMGGRPFVLSFLFRFRNAIE
jgi:hypothetical protein